MSLLNKLYSLRTDITDSIEEGLLLGEMTSDQIAKRYGYEKLLRYIRNLYFQKEAEMDVLDSEEEVKISFDMPVEIDPKINRFNIPNTNILGDKEEFHLWVVEAMLSKDGFKATIVNDEEPRLAIVKIKNKRSIKDQILDIYDNKDEYLSQASEIVKEYKDKATDGIKRLVNTVTVWIDEESEDENK